MAEESGAGRIVVGVDGSEPSKAALAWAVGQAALTHGTVEAIIAWHIPSTYGWGALPDGATWETEAEQVLKDALDAVAGAAAVEIRTAVVQGNPANALIDASRGAQLLVVGNRGHGGFGDLLLGSVSQQCVHHAQCPVVVMRGDVSAYAQRGSAAGDVIVAGRQLGQ